MFVRYCIVMRRLVVFGCALILLMVGAYYILPDNNDNIRYSSLSFVTSSEEEIDNLPKIVGVGIDTDSRSFTKASINGADQICRIPMLEKDRPEVMNLYSKAPPLKCEDKCGPNWLELDDENRIQATEFARKNIGLGGLTCEWTFFDRVDDKNLQVGKPSEIQLGEKVTEGDFFTTSCTSLRRNSTSIQKWHGIFMTVVAKSEYIKQLKAKKRPDHWSGLNVYLLGFDSVSQMEFRRSVPKTVDYLEKTLKSTVFNGYNIVGDGTPQAYIPFLTGQTELELPLTRKRYSNANYVDDVYPFAWRNFSDAGYATLYGEDAHGIGTFTYRLKGFRRQPTDHYPATFFHRYENCNEHHSIDKECCSRCVGDMPQHKMWFRYAESFWREYAEVPRYLVMHHSTLSHDSMNDFQLADDDLRDHLKKMYESGAFNNTMVIVMADHGRRFSKLRETHQGQLEERLPFFSLYLPEDLVVRSPIFAAAMENLRANAKNRLLSPFDMHATQMQLLQGWPDSADEFVKPVENPKNRSLSLFNSIPTDRTCQDAGIEAHWCTCLQWQDALVSRQLKLSKTLAKAVVRVFNNQTKPRRKLCAPLKLKRIISNRMLIPNDKMLKYSGANDTNGFVPNFGNKVNITMAIYQLVLETTPGNAKYEVTVNYDSGAANTIIVDLSSVSHVNAYGDQPHCIIKENYFLAAYCVCYDKI